MTETEQPDASRPEAPPAEAAAPPSEPAPPWEAQLDTYPSRPPEQDPRWALWLFWIWGIFASLSIIFMVVLLVLGWFYD